MRQTKPPPTSSVSLADGSLQVVASPCWEMALPDVISARLSLDAWTRTRSRFAGKRRSGRQMLGESAVKTWPCAKRPGWPSSVSRPANARIGTGTPGKPGMDLAPNPRGLRPGAGPATPNASSAATPSQRRSD